MLQQEQILGQIKSQTVIWKNGSTVVLYKLDFQEITVRIKCMSKSDHLSSPSVVAVVLVGGEGPEVGPIL